MPEPKLSALELRIMSELWSRGPCSIREIHEAVVKRDKPAYTTVQTMVYRLEVKGAVRRTKKIGNAHVFEATTSRASVQTRLLKELLGLFGGNARPVMAHLVEMGKISQRGHRGRAEAAARRTTRRRRRPEANRDDPRAARPLVAIDAVLRGCIWSITLAMRSNSAARSPLAVAAGIGEVSGAVFGAVSARRRGWAPDPCGDPAIFVRRRAAGRDSRGRRRPLSLVPQPRGATSSIAPALLAVWGVGAAGVALRWLRGWRAADLLSRAARPAPGALPDARVTDADIEPAVARVFHPVVLLPAALLGRLSAGQLDAVMAHEHEHIARHDNLKAQHPSAGRNPVLVSSAGVVHRPASCAKNASAPATRRCSRAATIRGEYAGWHPRGVPPLRRGAFHARGGGACRRSDAARPAHPRRDSPRVARLHQGLRALDRYAAARGRAAVRRRHRRCRAPPAAGRRHNARALWDADLAVNARERRSRQPPRGHATGTTSRSATPRCANSSRWPTASTPHGITGRGNWFDNERYDIRAVTRRRLVSEPERFDPARAARLRQPDYSRRVSISKSTSTSNASIPAARARSKRLETR